MSSPVPRPPTCPGAQGLTALQGRDTPRAVALGWTQRRTGTIGKGPLMPRAPDRFSSGRASPSPRTGGARRAPQDRGCPRQRGSKGSWQEAGSSDPEAVQASSGHFLPGYPSHGAVFHLVLTSAPSRLGLQAGRSQENHGDARTCRAHPGQRGCPSHAHQQGRCRGSCFRADSRVHIPSSGVRALGTGSRRVASGLPVTPTDLEHAGRAGPQTWRLGTLQPPWAPVGLGLWELNGGAEARLGWRREGGRGAGAGREWEAGVSQRLGTRAGEKQSQQFPREEVASPPPPPGLRAGSWPTGPAGPLPADVPVQLRSSEGSLKRPCLPAFLPMTTLATPLPCLRTTQGSGALGDCWQQPGGRSRCLQLGPGRPQTSERMDRKPAGGFLPAQEALAGPAELPEAAGGAGKGSEGGRGLALPRLSPGRLCRQR